MSSPSHSSNLLSLEGARLCALLTDTPASFAVRDALTRGEGWPSLIEAARDHQLAPALYLRIKELSLACPHSDEAWLRNNFLVNVQRASVQERCLADLLALCDAAGIRAIPLKGPVMTRLAYGDPGMRTASGDLDILIDQVDLDRALSVLAHAGYRRCVGDEEWPAYRSQQRQVTLAAPAEGGMPVDLHWDFRNRFAATHVRECWQRSRVQQVGPLRCRVLSPEDFVTACALSAATDYDFVTLKYLYDFHRAVGAFAETLSWQRVVAVARRHGIRGLVYSVAALSTALFGTAIPPAAMRQCRPRGMRAAVLARTMSAENVLGHREEVASSYWWRYGTSVMLAHDRTLKALATALTKLLVPLDESLACPSLGWGEKAARYASRLARPWRSARKNCAREKKP